MRLLSTKELENGKFDITKFNDEEIPQYAILSHTWGKEEVTYQEMMGDSMVWSKAKEKSGYIKIRRCCWQARSAGLDYVWIDTCCIDKTSSAELSEAINSMYRWYQDAKVCYAYLSDVPSKAFIESRWFTRGWTLQELIAPLHVEFFDEKWHPLEYTSELQQTISDSTGIPVSILSGEKELETFSVAQRMSWAARRNTSRIEDRAYCLMGIFGVNMPLIYGEKESAFIRLQQELLRISDDLSLFAWRSDNEDGILASSPAAFVDSRDIVCINSPNGLNTPPTASSRGIHLEVRFMGIGSGGLGLAILDCQQKGNKDQLIAIYVRDIYLTMQRFKRLQTDAFELVDLKKFNPLQYPLRNICINISRTPRKQGVGKQDAIQAGEIYSHDSLMKLMDFENRWALENAAREGRDDIVWLLLTRSDMRADFVPDSRSHLTPLLYAAQNGHVSTMKILFNRGGKIEGQGASIKPLDIAIEAGQAAAVEFLLENGASESIRTTASPPLSVACGRGDESIVQLLLAHGAGLYYQGVYGEGLLMRAAKKGRVSIVKLLLEGGVAIETQNSDANSDGWSLLSWATENRHESIVKILFERDARRKEKAIIEHSPLS